MSSKLTALQRLRPSVEALHQFIQFLHERSHDTHGADAHRPVALLAAGGDDAVGHLDRTVRLIQHLVRSGHQVLHLQGRSDAPGANPPTGGPVQHHGLLLVARTGCSAGTFRNQLLDLVTDGVSSGAAMLGGGEIGARILQRDGSELSVGWLTIETLSSTFVQLLGRSAGPFLLSGISQPSSAAQRGRLHQLALSSVPWWAPSGWQTICVHPPRGEPPEEPYTVEPNVSAKALPVLLERLADQQLIICGRFRKTAPPSDLQADLLAQWSVLQELNRDGHDLYAMRGTWEPRRPAGGSSARGGTLPAASLGIETFFVVVLSDRARAAGTTWNNFQLRMARLAKQHNLGSLLLYAPDGVGAIEIAMDGSYSEQFGERLVVRALERALTHAGHIPDAELKLHGVVVQGASMSMRMLLPALGLREV